MSENIYFDSVYQFTDPVRYFKANDPVYWEVTNIPIKQLEENVKWVKDQVEGVLGSVAQTVSSVQGQVGSTLGSFEIDRSKFSELRPYVVGTDNVVKVKAGKFTARVNDAYDINPLQIILGASGIGNGEINRYNVATLANSTVREIVEQFKQSAFFANANGLIERLFTYETAAPDTPGDITGLNQVRYPGKAGWGWWRDSSITSRLVPLSQNRGTLFEAAWLESDFIKKWRGVTRTSIVNIPSELSIEIPAFDPEDHFYYNESNTKVLLPATQRIDLLFIYSKPVDVSSTTIRSFGADGQTPKKITSAQLGLVKGAGIGVNLYRPDNNGSPSTRMSLVMDGTDSTTQKILSHHGDESGVNTGFGTIKGSFPSPDDLMNLAPYLSEQLESTDFRLIGQSILPVAYVVVKESAELSEAGVPIITSADIIDIRPFFRTTELSYNERAGLAAACPQISLANPVASEYYVDYQINTVATDIYSRIEGVNGSISDTTKLLTAGYIMGGYDYGMEGAAGRLLNLLENGSPGRDETFMKARVKDYFSYQRDIPQYPEWDIGGWVSINSSYTNKGQEPNDRFEIFYPNSTIATKSIRNGNSTLTTGGQNFIVLKKTIQFDGTSQGILTSNDYIVDVQLHNTLPLSGATISVERKASSFTIYIRLEATILGQFVNRTTGIGLFTLADSFQLQNYTTNVGNQVSRLIKNVVFTYPTVSFRLFSLPKTNVGLTTPMGGANPLITL